MSWSSSHFGIDRFRALTRIPLLLMPRRRNEPDPLADMRRKLEEQERILAEKMAQLNDPNAPPPESKPSEPPVWRLEDDSAPVRTNDLPQPLKRHLARQTQRDMLLFFIALGVLIIVMTILVWVVAVHNSAPTIGP